MAKPVVIFDLDGTLVDTSADLILAANAALSEIGVQQRLDPQKDAATAFRGGRAMLQLALDRSGITVGKHQALIAEGFPALLDAYREGIDHCSRPYPGAKQAVAKLGEAGYALGICTNKPEALAQLLMERLGWRSSFASLVGADTLPVRKPDPAPFHEAVLRAGGVSGRSVLLGDTETDYKTARAAEAPIILTSFGPHKASNLALRADAYFSDWSDVPEVIEGLLPL